MFLDEPKPPTFIEQPGAWATLNESSQDLRKIVNRQFELLKEATAQADTPLKLAEALESAAISITAAADVTRRVIQCMKGGGNEPPVPIEAPVRRKRCKAE